MNLTPSDMESIFSTDMDDQRKKSESDELTVDGELFMLPSQRKKALNQNNRKRNQRRRRQPRQSRLSLEQILNEDSEFNDQFEFSSDKTNNMSSTVEKDIKDQIEEKEIQDQVKEKETENEEKNQQQQNNINNNFNNNFNNGFNNGLNNGLNYALNNGFNNNFNNNINNNIIKPQQQQIQPNIQVQTPYVENLQPNIQKPTLASIESSLINYISTAVYSIREIFVNELKSLLDNSKNEQSIIDSFLLSLPSEIDELVASEIELVTNSYNSKAKISTLSNYVDSQLEPLQRMFPRPKTPVTNATIETLQDDVLNAKISMNEKYDELLNEVQDENDILSSLREKSIIFEDRKRKDNPNSILLIEAEADSKRLEVEKQFSDFRKKRLNKIQSYWKESEFNASEYPLSSSEFLCKKISLLAKKVPQSKYKNAATSLSSLYQNFQGLTRDLHALHKKVVHETNSFMNNPVVKEENNNVDNFNFDSLNEYEFSSAHSKGKNKRRKMSEKKFHSSRSASSRGSSDSSMIANIKEQLSELRKERQRHDQLIEENNNVL